MRFLSLFAVKLRMLFGRKRAGAQLDDELRFHLERQVAENVASGMSADNARSAALRSFGNPALLREQARATWSWAWLESLLHELRYGMRTLSRTPGFAAIAILVMALGIGEPLEHRRGDADCRSDEVGIEARVMRGLCDLDQVAPRARLAAGEMNL